MVLTIFLAKEIFKLPARDPNTHSRRHRRFTKKDRGITKTIPNKIIQCDKDLENKNKNKLRLNSFRIQK